MQIICPCCSAKFSIEAVLSDVSARRMVEFALKLPAPAGDQVLRYIALFRPEGRALSWSRAVKLLQQLQADISRGQIERRGRAWAAPFSHWQLALDEMLNMAGKLTLPLKSHGYLYEILVGLADKAEATREKQIEGRRRSVPDRPDVKPTGEIKSELKSVQTLLNASTNDSVRQALQRQADKLEAELAGGGVDN